MSSSIKSDKPTLNNANPTGEKIRFGEKFGYGMGGAANNVIWTGITSFLVYFYTDVLGIAAGIIGTIMLFSRIFDGVSDIAMGMVVDRTTSRHGKARPWLLWLAIPFAIAGVLLFTVPDIGNTGTLIYIIITYNVTLLIYTAVEIPHGTLGALISQDQRERNALNVAKMVGAYIAIIAISNLTVPLTEVFGGGQSGWIYTFILFGIIAAVIYFITFRTTNERVKRVEKEQQKLPIKTSIMSLVKNKYWFITTIVFTLMYVWNGLTAGAAIYYSEYILGDPVLVGVITTGLTLATLLGLAIVTPITNRIGKRNGAIIGCAIALVGSLFILVNPTSFVVVLIGQITRGLGKAFIMGILFSMLADTIEYGEWKTGVRIEGLVYSGASMGIKIGSGLGSAFLGWGLALGGYVGTQAMQSDTALFTINALFIYVPAILTILMLITLCFYKLDKQYPQILAELRSK